ncbi:uncharacterized protein LOC111622748 isoform X2 [Centruroides sculpturatus]|uniref:uncharacterized protein LOC111622748 isoform X2 n=1 Tax=Centruroides sculpturatus TaxID=218467 RepID=UPI000C6CF3B5|nr:uncharacterized protein LOC111622748 isoform X2 [Centruroides sculpturatus]
MEESREVLKAEEKCSTESPNKFTGDPTISAPIYFLVREQAKLMVTIKEIHRRLKLLEESQNNVTSAVQAIKFQMNLAECNNHAVSLPILMHSKDSISNNVKSEKSELQNSFVTVFSNELPSNKKHDTVEINKQDSYNNCEKSEFMKDHIDLKENEIKFQSLCEVTDKLITDCDKQDSGLESDHGQGGNHHTNSGGMFSDIKSKKKDQDELLVLLDIIKEKGISLRQEVDDLKELTKSDIDHNSVSVGSEVEKEMERLNTEKESLQQLIGEVEDEKSTMKNKLLFLETASQELKQENKKLIENLELALSEKQQLEMKIHSLHMQFVKGTSTPKAESWPPLRFANSEKSRKLEKDSSNIKISHILNETNTLELQRKLLLYLMENEVLYAKLWHAEQSLLTRTSEWKKTEVNLHSRLRRLAAAKDELQIKLGENNLELTAAQAKVEMLEKVLGAVTQDSRDEFNFGYSNRSSFKDMYSLPVLREGANKKFNPFCREIKPFSNQSTFVDITLVHPEKCQKLSNDIDHYEYMAASTIEANEPRSSTPCPIENEWVSCATNSTLITFENNTITDTSTSKTTDKELSIMESDYTPTLSQQLSRNEVRTENHSKSSLSDFSNGNESSMWESISNKEHTPMIHNGFSVSALNSSLNTNVIKTVCQNDNQFPISNEKTNAIQAASLNMNGEYDFGMHLKNSADIRQQIQDILDHITGITAADEALV